MFHQSVDVELYEWLLKEQKRLERYLVELKELGLIEKRGDKYCWYIYLNQFEDREDYSAKLQHSKKLIPALKQRAGITASRSFSERGERYDPEDMKILLKSAEDHLKAYSQLWKLFEEYRDLSHQAEEMEDRLKANLRGSWRQSSASSADTTQDLRAS